MITKTCKQPHFSRFFETFNATVLLFWVDYYKNCIYNITANILCIRHAGSTTTENRIYIRGEFTRKMCKTAILLYCFHTVGVLHISALYNLLGPGTLATLGLNNE